MSRSVIVVIPLVFAVACSEPVQVGARPVPARAPGPPPIGAPPVATPAAETADAGVDAGPRVYRDVDFVELDVLHRDPFRDYILALAAQAPITSTIPIIMRDVSLDQMRLIAVVTGVPVPYAMIIDPAGVGHVVKRGDAIGRPEVLNAGGADGLPIALNWKIDRIRQGEVVLARADPLHPDQPPLMRSLLLRDANQEDEYSVGVVQGQLGNTGDGTAGTGPDAPTPNAPTPGGSTFVPAPTPPPTSTRSGRTYGSESGPTIAPAPTTTTPNTSTSSGSGSRFGGVFGPRR